MLLSFSFSFFPFFSSGPSSAAASALLDVLASTFSVLFVELGISSLGAIVTRVGFRGSITALLGGLEVNGTSFLVVSTGRT